ncbi:MAG: ABC transporter ATP-binding protein [bacterium]|nr:ABC transporter ATP-binding protein [bacterium]
MRSDVLLQVDKLKKYFIATKGLTRRIVGLVKAVDEISFDIRHGETVGLVGESGCGKTTVGRCLLRAIEPTSGRILFRFDESHEPVDICRLEKEQLKEIRRWLRLIFQDPYSSLNPRMNVMEIIAEPLIVNRLVTNKTEIEHRVAEMLKHVGLDPQHLRRYPHAFSGGQRQRIAIARALISEPKFVVADEPISALDVSVQAQILNLLQELQEKFKLTYLFIAHNLAAVEHISERIAVMYVGKLVELADTEELFAMPKHPYTEALLSAASSPEPGYKEKKKRIILEGDIADPANPPTGCYFHPRCRYAKEICKLESPAFVNINPMSAKPHYSACHFAETLNLAGISG